MTFTATGDDGVDGRASKYELRTAATQQGFDAMRKDFMQGMEVPKNYYKMKASQFSLGS